MTEEQKSKEYYEVTEKDFVLTEQEMWDEAMGGQSAWDDYLDTQALELMFKRGGHWHSYLSDYNVFQKAFYWLKTLICLCFQLRSNGDYDELEIMNFNIGHYGENGASWDCLYVGSGMFKNWRYNICSDSV